MTTVFFPLPLKPKDSNQEPCTLLQLGEDFQNQNYRVNQVFQLNNNYVGPGTFFDVEVIGLYQNMLLVKPIIGHPSSDFIAKAKQIFFKTHNPEEYKEISQEKYWQFLESQTWHPNT